MNLEPVEVRVRRVLELLAILVFIALLASTGIDRYQSTPKVAVRPPGSLTICGIRPGMSRAAVVKKLGQPLSDKPDDVYRVFSCAKYGAVDGYFGQPDITYNSNGQVLGLSGASLEWPGGQLKPEESESSFSRLFPGGIILANCFSEPASPGEIYFPERNLTVFTEVAGMFSSPTIFRAKLCVPYLARRYWTSRSDGQDLLSETARMSQRPNKSLLELSETTGCFYCMKILDKKPLYPYHEANLGVCPECRQETLLGGNSSKITLGYLREVHHLWLDPLP